MSKPRRRPPPAARAAARLGAVQALFQMDLAGTDVGEVLAQFSARAAGEDFEDGQCGEADYGFLKEIVTGAVAEQRRIDVAINAALDQSWPIVRLDATLRAILRAAAYEIMVMPHVPARAAISEYVEVAHAFFGGEEPKFVNGVLDKLARRERPGEFA
jgi:transcription antitermination protein NusB